MHVQLHCPNCLRDQQAEIQLPGQTVPCESCGQPLTAFMRRSEVPADKPKDVDPPAQSPAAEVAARSAPQDEPGIATDPSLYFEERKAAANTERSTPASRARHSAPRTLDSPSEPDDAEVSSDAEAEQLARRRQLYSDIFWGTLLTLVLLTAISAQPLLPVFPTALRRFVLDQLSNIGLMMMGIGVAWILFVASQRDKLIYFLVPFYYFVFVGQYREASRRPASLISSGLLIIVMCLLARLLPVFSRGG